MAEDKNIEPGQIEERSPATDLTRGVGTDLAQAVVGGMVGGVAGAATTQVIGKLTGANKTTDEPKK